MVKRAKVKSTLITKITKSLAKLFFVILLPVHFANGIEGTFSYQGHQQTLSTEVESEFLVNLLTPRVREVAFGPLQSLTTQFEGENLVQYEADQDVHINDLVFHKATYFEFKDFVKVTVGNQDSENYFSFVISNGSISSMESVQYAKSDSAYKTHWVESTLEQN